MPRHLVSILVTLTLALFFLTVPLLAQGFLTERVSTTSTGGQANDRSDQPEANADGSLVVFSSEAGNLVANDVNNDWDVFLKNRATGELRLISRTSSGTTGNAAATFPDIAASAPLVAFSSEADDLVPNDTNFSTDIFLHRLDTGTITRVPVGLGGAEPTGGAFQAALTPDGAYMAFTSGSNNLVVSDTNTGLDIFRLNVATGEVVRVSVSSSGAQNNSSCGGPEISADGNLITFSCEDGALVPGDTNFWHDIFIKNVATGEVRLVSTATGAPHANGPSTSSVMSADGRYVAFETYATNLISGTVGQPDVLLKDLATGALEHISVSSDETPANGLSASASISADGNLVAFHALATNLVPGDTNGLNDIFVRDRAAGTTTRVNVSSSGTQANNGSGGPDLSSDGMVVVYGSSATNLVPGDTNGQRDIFATSGFAGPPGPTPTPSATGSPTPTATTGPSSTPTATGVPPTTTPTATGVPPTVPPTTSATATGVPPTITATATATGAPSTVTPTSTAPATATPTTTPPPPTATATPPGNATIYLPLIRHE